MYVSKERLIAELPPYQDKWVMIKKEQGVPDIINEMLQAHREFAPYYDSICHYFIGRTLKDTCETLFEFCQENITYREEGEDWQSSALPTGILMRGHGDCKHYASFIAGILDAIKRTTGQKIDWHYCFASYKIDQPVPYHVFVVVETNKGPLWVDPTPGALGKTPVWEINKKVGTAIGNKNFSDMAIVRNIAGIPDQPGSYQPVMGAVGPDTTKMLLLGGVILFLFFALKKR